MRRCIFGLQVALILAFTSAAVWVIAGIGDPGGRYYKVSSPGRYVAAYYFHLGRCCPTCKKIEELSREAIEDQFKDDIESGRLVFRSINIDQKGNSRYVDEFQLYTRSFVIVEMNGDNVERHKNLTRIEELIRDPDAFRAYVTKETLTYLHDLRS